MARSVIITCAITGSLHTPSMSRHLPITPAEIAAGAIEAAQAGASILHLHARNPSNGRPTADPAVFQQFLPCHPCRHRCRREHHHRRCSRHEAWTTGSLRRRPRARR